ncbi:MAG: hypothetical protein R3212_05045 [Xanthomonadales bacterium]|nr:hypothetical protein [Xanthomonadales bacterium]
MSFFQELRKRRVFRVAGAYIIVAWLLVQVADIFFPALNLPDWSITLVAGLVILGFPVAVLLAWAYQVTPEGVVRTSGATAGDSAPPPAGNRLNYVIVGLLVVVVGLLLVDRFLLGNPTGNSRVTTSPVGSGTTFAGVIPLPESAPLAPGIAAIGFDGPLIALSPDGRWLVYVGRFDGGSRLYLHNLGTFESPSALAGTEGAIHPFFSPDGAWIGFVTDDKVKRVSLDGQEVQSIAAATAPVSARWVDEDTIYLFDEQANAVSRVQVGSGVTERLIYSDSHRFNDVLQDGRHALASRFPASIDGDQGHIEAVNLEDGSATPLGIQGFDPRDLGTGHLAFSRNSNLQVVRFDARKLEVTGKPRVVQGGIALDSIFYRAQVAISESGALAFVPGADSGVGRIVRQMQRGGAEIVTPEPLKYGVFDLGHDDQTLAIHVGDVADYVWILDLPSRNGRKLPGSDGFGWPVTSPTGDTAMVGLDQPSDTNIRLGHFDRTANERDIELPGLNAYAMDFSNDGGTLSLTAWEDGGRIGRLPLGDRPAVEWIDGANGDWGAVYSPDGNWLAYASIQTGRYEIWIRPADGTGTPRQLSVNGGIEPVWCDCGEVYYRRGEEIWSTAVVTGERPETGSEALAFTMTDFLDTPGRSYDVSSDGLTLYYVQLAEPAVNDRVHVITHFLGTVAD